MKRLLGKRAVQHDPRTLRMAKYVLPDVQVPSEVSWIMSVDDWPMMLNDTLGDCVLAAAGHMMQQWSCYANPPGFVPSDADVLRAYEVVGGYDPSDPSTDQGASMLKALKYWRKNGIAGRKISAFVKLNPHNRAEIMMASWLFGNVYAGFQLPLSAQDATSWTVADGGTSTDAGTAGGWGGHCVPIMAASQQTLSCVTWGSRLKMSWNFLKNYADEMYAVLSPDWIEQSGIARCGFDLTTLQKDLAAL